jgi:prepilin-type processing-associated H-X9-DG protein
MINIQGSGKDPGWKNKHSNYDRILDSSAHIGTNAIIGGGAWDGTRSIAWRHRGGANVCFFDGHVQWLPKGDIYATDTAGNIIERPSLWKVME